MLGAQISASEREAWGDLFEALLGCSLGPSQE